MSTIEQFVVFLLGNEEYAISVDQVREIVCYAGATKLPNEPDYIEGIINLRGRTIPVVNLAQRFDLLQEKVENRRVIIVESLGMEVGVVVNEVTEVLLFDDSDIEPVPAIYQGNNFIRGIGNLKNRLLIILDIDKIFNEKEHLILKKAV